MEKKIDLVKLVKKTENSGEKFINLFRENVKEFKKLGLNDKEAIAYGFVPLSVFLISIIEGMGVHYLGDAEIEIGNLKLTLNGRNLILETNKYKLKIEIERWE